jgi:3-oxoacyl-[acyl-carrier protein] reductase
MNAILTYHPQMTDRQWETMLAVHNTAPFRLVRAAAPYFRVKDKEPRVIINISSTSGIHGNAYVPFPVPLPISAPSAK